MTREDPVDVNEDTGRRARWVWWVVGVTFATVVLVGAALGMRFGTDPSVVDSPMIGRSVPDLTLPYLERPDSLALRATGAEVLVVNFWASWCVPCRNEHDDLLAAASRYSDRDVEFLGIVFQDQPSQAIAFLDELGRGYDHVTDPGSLAAIEFGVFGVPETYVIDRDGTIRAKIVGESDIGLLSATIEDVLAGRQPGTRVVGDTESR
jgi:cytochrome c biogenesis protein CcmG/thiol:disulfide interchange protein DsbE